MPDPAVSGTRNEPLSEMLRIDEICQRFEAAWKSGDRPLIEEYCRDMPEPERSSLVKELLSLELSYREQLGEQPSKEEYLQRFPEHREVLVALLDTVRSAQATEGEGGASRGLRDLHERTAALPISPQSGIAAKTKALAATVSSPPLPSALESPLPQIPGFEVLAVLGRGGMGIVYLARQLKLGRKVALKVLPPGVAGDPERLRRFRNEAEIAAKLADCRIVPVLDIIEADGAPILVMQFIEGCDLGRIIADRQDARAGKSAEGRHPWASLSDRDYLERMLPVLDMVLESIVALHQGQVVHRDIKPSNILIDQRNNAWLGDFGLARLGQGSGMTCPGVGVGTHGFMSPEQWDGKEDVGPLSDVFSVGVTLYQALTLELPYGRDRVSDRRTPPVAPSKRQGRLSTDVDTVLLKTLEPDQRHRYASAKELQQDWQRVRHGLLPLAQRPGPIRRTGRQLARHPGMVAAIILIGFLGVLVIAMGLSQPGANKVAPRTVSLATERPGARIAFVPLNERGELQPNRVVQPPGRTPIVADLPPGEYLVIAKLSDKEFHEVYRTVPAPGQPMPSSAPHGKWTELPDGTIKLPPITIFSSDAVRFSSDSVPMAHLAGGTFHMGDPNLPFAPPCQVTVSPFYLDCTEVTVGSFSKKMEFLPKKLLGDKRPPDDEPVTSITFDTAAAYAEKVGKRLMTEEEYECAATNLGRTTYPWGSERSRITAWPIGPVGMSRYDFTDKNPRLYDLFGNVGEWTASPYVLYHTAAPEIVAAFNADARVRRPDLRVVRGATPGVVEERRLRPEELASVILTPRFRMGYARTEAHPGLGFRGARSERPRYLLP